MQIAAFALVVFIAPAAVAAETQNATPAGPLTIVLYDQPDFKGRAVTVDRAVANLATLNMEDRVSSFTIKGAGDWVLCEHRNFAGRCVRVQAQAQNLNLFPIVGRVSSLYPAPAAAPAAATPAL